VRLRYRTIWQGPRRARLERTRNETETITINNNATKGVSMSSLPFISHHLFVAAARQENEAARKPAQRTIPSREMDNRAETIRLEMVSQSVASGPSSAMRTPRTPEENWFR